MHEPPFEQSEEGWRNTPSPPSVYNNNDPPSPPRGEPGIGDLLMASPADRARNGSKRKRDLAALAAEDPMATRDGRLAWAREHIPDYGDRIVLLAMWMAERRPRGEITEATVRAELDRIIGAEPLQERPAA